MGRLGSGRSCELTPEQVEQPQVCGLSSQRLHWVTASVDALPNQWQVVGLALDGDALEAFDDARLDGCAGACERFEDGAAGWGDEPDEPAHE